MLMTEEIGERIRNLREVNGYTREKFAESAKISKRFLYEIESGRKKFSAETLCRIASELNVSCDYIMRGWDYNNLSLEKRNAVCLLNRFSAEQMGVVLDMLDNMYYLGQS
ncbi:MAG: helix-turn-helix transcriptional regulator [Lachnospira sp.]|nr:helix-turn-helix transcriptional regulator [Lachnospira sp.]